MTSTTYFGTNRAGQPCCVYSDGTHDAYETVELAANAVRRANAQVRVQPQRAARELAMTSLGALSRKLGVGLRVMPAFLPSSTSIAHPAESAVCA